MSTPEQLSQRVVDLEILVTHLQHDLQTLNEVILDQQKQLDLFREVIGRLDDRMARLDTTEKFDPGLERPPHY